jgi:hypothetical protein
VLTISPSSINNASNFPSGIPAYRWDAYNCHRVDFPNRFGGPDKEITHSGAPHDGSHVQSTLGISAKGYGPDSANRMQIHVDGIQQADYWNVSALTGTATVTLPGPGTHRVAVRAYDRTKSAWVKSGIYVTDP